jgi:F-type H+-transporting ATPase subunit b
MRARRSLLPAAGAFLPAAGALFAAGAFLFAAGALFAAGVAHAEGAAHGEGGGHGPGLMDLVYQAVNLAILLVVLVYFARKPIQNFFASRREQIRGDLDEAANLLDTAEARYAEWQRKLIDLERDTEKIRSDGLRVAEEEAARILSDAEAAAGRIQRDAEAAIGQELRRAQAELRAEAATLAMQLAEKILREKLADSDRERLLDEFIVGVEPSNRGAN